MKSCQKFKQSASKVQASSVGSLRNYPTSSHSIKKPSIQTLHRELNDSNPYSLHLSKEMAADPKTIRKSVKQKSSKRRSRQQQVFRSTQSIPVRNTAIADNSPVSGFSYRRIDSQERESSSK